MRDAGAQLLMIVFKALAQFAGLPFSSRDDTDDNNDRVPAAAPDNSLSEVKGKLPANGALVEVSRSTAPSSARPSRSHYLSA
jgi:hypothetical protein